MSVKLTKYTIDRRDLFRLTAMGAGGLFLANLDALAADTVCQTLKDEKLGTSPMDYTNPGVLDPGDESASLYFMIDGTYTNFYMQNDSASINLTTKFFGTDRTFSSLSADEKKSLRILTKARVSIHCEFDQNDLSYVESVILSDASQQILALRRFTPNDFILLENVRKTPYVVFERLNLVENEPLFITYVRRTASNAKIYQYKIEGRDAGPSRLDFKHLPLAARSTLSSDFLGDILGGEASTDPLNRGSHSYLIKGKDVSDSNKVLAAIPPYPFDGSGGYVATAYYNQRPVPQHSVRARCININNNGNFKFEIEMMHGDLNLGHYMRYFLVLDPVGRILGGLRRDVINDSSNPPRPIDQTNYNRNLGNQKKTSGGGFTVADGAIEGAPSTMDFKISKYKITDMPHVQIITEDVVDAIGRISFKIR